MTTAWEDLDDSQFERVVVELARTQFGEGVQEFAAGPDGGRDAKFHGTAERFPSTTSPWQGITVIQAKHTNHLNSHFSERDFSGSGLSSVLSNEIPRIRRLFEASYLNNYYLVSNRRLSGNAGETIADRISDESGLAKSSIHIVGIEMLESAVIRNPEILKYARLNPAENPLIASSYEIASVIVEFSDVLQASTPAPTTPVERVAFTEKNRINGMSDEMAQALEMKNLKYERQIEDFLAHPANTAARENYEEAAFEFKRKIIAYRDQFDSFDRLYNHLLDTLLGRDGILRAKVKLTNALLFYMYWHCDIGKNEDADS